jgi:hypothetical protein
VPKRGEPGKWIGVVRGDSGKPFYRKQYGRACGAFDTVCHMAQFPVLAYQLQVSTAPPQQQQGVPPPEFIPRVTITVQTGQGPRNVPLPIQSASEFMAICALMQVQGRLVFDDIQETLEKMMP